MENMKKHQQFRILHQQPSLGIQWQIFLHPQTGQNIHRFQYINFFSISTELCITSKSYQMPPYNEFKCSIYAANEEVEPSRVQNVINDTINALLSLKTMQGIR